jgi:hypothetical protein
MVLGTGDDWVPATAALSDTVVGWLSMERLDPQVSNTPARPRTRANSSRI